MTLSVLADMLEQIEHELRDRPPCEWNCGERDRLALSDRGYDLLRQLRWTVDREILNRQERVAA
jgi:hypothetical protein